ncbi:MAG TPA: MFS transporter [Candidatus Limnocylindria bacterium]|jgi:MFS family permease|nr:MFS transporter [Candidatus Limnocylindria bacterium]
MTHIDLTDVEPGLPAGTGSVFRNRNFVFLWSAQVLSQLASNMVLAALMAVVVGATGSNTANALLILTFLVPAVVFSALAGVLVERSDARWIMILSNLGRAFGCALFIALGANVFAILVLNFAISTISAFFGPAELIAITRLVERRHLMAANSIFILTVNATFGIGFGVIGPLLLTTLGPNAVYVTVSVMFALAAVAIIPLPSVKPEKTPRPFDAGKTMTHVLEELREGIAFVQNTPRISWSLRYLVIGASIIGVLGALGPGYATGVLNLSAEDIFFIMGPAGLGAVMGILFINSFGQYIPRRLLIDVGLMLTAAMLLAIALVGPLTDILRPTLAPIEEDLPDLLGPLLSVIALVIVIAFGAGIAYALIAIPAQTSLQEELPPDVRGRIFGILNTLLSVASFFPVLVAPVIADLVDIMAPGFGIPFVLLALALFMVWVGVVSWRNNAALGLHQRVPPDQIPGQSPDQV